jgi:hypothetical protein
MPASPHPASQLITGDGRPAARRCFCAWTFQLTRGRESETCGRCTSGRHARASRGGGAGALLEHAPGVRAAPEAMSHGRHTALATRALGVAASRGQDERRRAGACAAIVERWNDAPTHDWSPAIGTALKEKVIAGWTCTDPAAGKRPAEKATGRASGQRQKRLAVQTSAVSRCESKSGRNTSVLVGVC